VLETLDEWGHAPAALAIFEVEVQLELPVQLLAIVTWEQQD
jgi:hypothetical protein